MRVTNYRIRWIANQLLFIAIIIAIGWLGYENVSKALDRLGMGFGFEWLNWRSGFDVGFVNLMNHTSDQTYRHALLTGLVNTVYVSAIGIVLMTLWATLVAVVSLSRNWLLATSARAYIEIVRNIPLLIFIIFIYVAVMLQFPVLRQAYSLLGILISNRGIYLPTVTLPHSGVIYVVIVSLVYLMGLIILNRMARRDPLMRRFRGWLHLGYLMFVGLGLALFAMFSVTQYFHMSFPILKGFNIQGGIHFTTEFCALLFSLVIYTSTYAAEVIRAGLESVPVGQTEAAKALGLTSGQSFRFVIIPQSMPVIVPPMLSQFMNLTKNSSLAVAIGYPDLVAVAGTTNMQTGRAIEVWICLVMVLYLGIDLILSLCTNLYNKSFEQWRGVRPSGQ